MPDPVMNVVMCTLATTLHTIAGLLHEGVLGRESSG